MLDSRRLQLLFAFLVCLSPSMAAAGSDGSMAIELSSPIVKEGRGELRQLYEKSYALVVGNDEYGQGWPRLSTGVSDAEKVSAALQQHGFLVTLHKNLDKFHLEAAIEEFIFGPGAEPNSRVLIWFAGHGHTVEGEGYLVPVDAKPVDPANVSSGGYRRSLLSLRRFGEYMREARGRHVMAIFDSCFSGTIFSVARSKPESALTETAMGPSRQYISSGDAGQEVGDDGSFQKLFVEAISKPTSPADVNGDGYVTGSELGLYLSERIAALTANKQIPRYGYLRDTTFSGGDIVFKTGEPAAASTTLSSVDPANSAKRLQELISEAEKLLKVLGYEVKARSNASRRPSDADSDDNHARPGSPTLEIISKRDGVEAMIDIDAETMAELRAEVFTQRVSPSVLAALQEEPNVSGVSVAKRLRAIAALPSDADDDSGGRRRSRLADERRNRDLNGAIGAAVGAAIIMGTMRAMRLPH